MDLSSSQTRAVVGQQEQGNIREALGSCGYVGKQILPAKEEDDGKHRSERGMDMRSQNKMNLELVDVHERLVSS